MSTLVSKMYICHIYKKNLNYSNIEVILVFTLVTGVNFLDRFINIMNYTFTEILIMPLWQNLHFVNVSGFKEVIF